MSVLIIMSAVAIAIVLFGGLAAAAVFRDLPEHPADIQAMLTEDVLTDEELQSYLPDQKIEAIKRYRELTGHGLKLSKDVVEYMIANPNAKKIKTGLAADTRGAGVRDLVLEGRYDEAVAIYEAFMGVDKFTAQEAIRDLRREINAEIALSDDNDLSDIQHMLNQGRKIEAIKAYMAQTGVSLKEAKQSIEDM